MRKTKRIIQVILAASLAVMTAMPASASTTISTTAKTSTHSVTCTGGVPVTNTPIYSTCGTCGPISIGSKQTCNACHTVVSMTTCSGTCPQHTINVSSSTYPHGTISQTSTDYYYNNTYAYRGGASTCRAYTLDINKPTGVSTYLNNVTNRTYNMTATKTDYIVSGNYVTVTLSNSTSSTLQVSLNGATPVAATGSIYEFAMPAKDSTLEFSYAQQAQTINVTTPITKTYNSPSFNLGATVS